MDKARHSTHPLIGILAILYGMYFLYGMGASMMDRYTAATLTAQMKTACIGRFLVDLPQSMDFSYRGAYVRGFAISAREETREAFEARVLARRKVIEAEPSQPGRNSLEAADDYRKNGFAGTIFRFGRSATKGEENGKPVDWVNVKLEAYVHAEGGSFDFIGHDYDAARIDNLPKLLDKLRLVPAGQLPTAAGFCFGRGMLLDPLPAHYTEGVTMFAGFRGHADLAIALMTRAGTEPDKEGRLARDTAVDADMPLWQRPLMNKLRKGKRNINGIEGDEVAEKWNELNFVSTFNFNWEVNGTNHDVLVPFMHLEMSTGHPAHAGARPVGSFLGEQALLQLWDGISSSIRVRPTLAAPSARLAPPAIAPGTTASAGEPCPASGWWECMDAAPGVQLAGGPRRFFHQGERLPQAWLLRPQSLWDRLRGIQPGYRLSQPTNWTLAERRQRVR